MHIILSFINLSEWNVLLFPTEKADSNTCNPNPIYHVQDTATVGAS